MGMMAARLGDRCTGHGCWPSRVSISGSPTVFINGKPAHRQGDAWAVHCCPKKGCHGSVLAAGSPVVYTDGRQQGRVGDPVACGSRVLTGSPNVFVGSGSPLPPPQSLLDIVVAELNDEPQVDNGLLVFPQPANPTPQAILQSRANGRSEEPPTVQYREEPSVPAVPLVPVSCDGLRAPFSSSLKLSDHYTLADLTTRVLVGGNGLRAQHGRSEAELVCNLKKVAENILEPIRTLYPTVRVNNGFRHSGSINESGNISQHEMGQAVDISFPNMNKHDYFRICSELSGKLAFDQLIFEYSSRPNSYWIHISYSERARRIVLTRVRQGDYRNGLVLV